MARGINARKTPTPRKNALRRDKRGGRQITPDRIEEVEEPIFEEFRSDGFDANEDLLNMEIPPPPTLLMNANGTGARLIITHIEVENFKSYYGRQSIGPFHKNFTAIIGPNGSGKSNVIDSLLFVFGYRASKIRSKKMSAMIHSSAGKEDINSCTVSVYFQKIIDLANDKKEIVEGSQFYVSRTVYRDSTSRYTLDGRVTNFKEIAKILRGSGIDLDHNRFLILQGEVEQISLMKPKAQTENEEGMLEYLEDIIGSNRLKLPINKLRHKLEILQEQRASQLLRVRYAEKEKLALEEPTKKIISQIRLENALTLANNKILSVKKLNISDQVEDLEPEKAKLAIELKNSNDEMAELALQNGHLKKEQKRIQKLLDEKQEQLTKANALLGQLKQDSLKMQNDKKRSMEQFKKLTLDLAKEELKISELIEVPEKSQKKVEELTKKLEKDEQIIEESSKLIEEKLAMVEEQTAALREDKKKLDIEFGKYSSIEDEIGSKLVLAQFEMKNFQSDEEKERRKLNELRETLLEKEEKLQRKISDRRNTESTLPILKEEIDKLQEGIKELRKQEYSFVEQIRKLQIELEHNRQNAEQFKSSNRLLQALMEQKRLGKLSGIFGRLGDLGAIDEKFDVAISTTCGALDNIVVDSVNTAQNCIQFLKREKLGIASFIALDKQQHLMAKMRSLCTTPENAPRLFDLIRVEDENVLPAFYYALQDTLVADNIEKATRISMSAGRRWRTVTLEGEVVEVSGAMTGGGNMQKRGRIGQSVKVNTRVEPTSLKDYNKQINELKEIELRLNEVRKNLAHSEAQCKEKLADLSRNRNFFNNTNVDIKNLEMSVHTLKSQLDEQNKRLSRVITNPQKLAEMLANIKTLKKEQEDINEKTDALRMETIALSEKIDKINNDNVGQCQRARADAEERKKQYEKQITKEKSAISLNDRNMAKARARKLDLENDLAKIESFLSELENSQQIIEQKISDQTNLIEKCLEEVKETEENYKNASLKGKELNSDELLLQQKFSELQKKHDEINHKIVVLTGKMDQIEAKLSKMKLYYFKELADLPEDVKGHENDDINLHDSILDESIFVEEELQRRQSQNEFLNDSAKTSEHSENEQIVDSTNKEKDLSNFDVPLKKNIRKVPIFQDSKIREFDLLDLEFQLENLTRRKEQQTQKGEINIAMLLEYLEKVKRYDFETHQLQELTTQKDLHMHKCEMLKKQRLQEFIEGFHKIGDHLKEMYQMITQGGDASLDLVDSLDPFSEGVSFGVRPPKKSWKQITNLSGGEKTLASLALVFGLHHYRPTPLYVMDEIDAALDFRNVSIISSYIVERTKNAQFIVISLRNNMFERGDRIVGIYKVKDCTYNAVIDPKAAQKKFKKNLKAINAYMKKLKEEECEENLDESEIVDDSQIIEESQSDTLQQQLGKRRSDEAIDETGGVRNPKRRLFTNVDQSEQ